jgi:hypothetical protein
LNFAELCAFDSDIIFNVCKFSLVDFDVLVPVRPDSKVEIGILVEATFCLAELTVLDTSKFSRLNVGVLPIRVLDPSSLTGVTAFVLTAFVDRQLFDSVNLFLTAFDFDFLDSAFEVSLDLTLFAFFLVTEAGSSKIREVGEPRLLGFSSNLRSTLTKSMIAELKKLLSSVRLWSP